MRSIELTKGAIALVDDSDYEWLSQFEWQLLETRDEKRYAARGANRDGVWGSFILMHREILGLQEGDPNQGEHIDGDGLNNQRSNLRVATPKQNSRNKRGYCSSGVKGAYKQGDRWRAKIMVDGKQIHLGYFNTVEEAGAAYAEAAEKYFGEFSCTEHINANKYSAFSNPEPPSNP